MGRDRRYCMAYPTAIDFNPLSPHGERPLRHRSGNRPQAISIHSPRMGRDPSPTGGARRTANFNPLSPHGERLCQLGHITLPFHFNPLSPHGERPKKIYNNIVIKKFQSTLPAWGETRIFRRVGRIFQGFQSTLPAWGETANRRIK